MLPAPQVDGVVWKQAIAGNTVFAGGDFSKARPFGVALGGPGEIDVSNLIAYDLGTGELDTSFHPDLNGVINDMAVTPDGTKLVVVGNFTKVGTATRNRVAVFDLPTAPTDPTLNTIAPTSTPRSTGWRRRTPASTSVASSVSSTASLGESRWQSRPRRLLALPFQVHGGGRVIVVASPRFSGGARW